MKKLLKAAREALKRRDVQAGLATALASLAALLGLDGDLGPQVAGGILAVALGLLGVRKVADARRKKDE